MLSEFTLRMHLAIANGYQGYDEEEVSILNAAFEGKMPLGYTRDDLMALMRYCEHQADQYRDGEANKHAVMLRKFLGVEIEKNV